MPNKKTVAVIFGGKSAEHDISIITAHLPIISSLLTMPQYEVVPVYITKQGVWYSDPAMNNIDYFRQGDLEAKLKALKPLTLSLSEGLSFIQPGLRQRATQIDVVFPAMHGTYGEDGSLMGLLRMSNVPFVGCDLAASAVAMDKALTKQIAHAEGLPVVPYTWFTKHTWTADRDTVLANVDKLSWPLFVKPVHLGSSIAITKVQDATELERAIEVALHYDNKVLVEESVEDLVEVTLPIMGNDEPRTALLERPLHKTEFFNFEDKYLSKGKKGSEASQGHSELPAKLDEELAERLRTLGKQAYSVLGCSGIARIDFLVDAATNTAYINEVNTLPGSLYHHNWKQAGVSNHELIEELIRLAEERFEQEGKQTYVFQSNILQR